MGVVKADLKRMLTKIGGAIGYKHDPKMRQELLAAFEEDIVSVMGKYGYVAEAESEDHEVGMAMGQLEAMFNAIQELEDKIFQDGEERDIPGWIQSHITSAYEYIKQANDNFHELEEAFIGDVTLPQEGQVGSGDVPAGSGDAEEENKKNKKERMKYLKTFESFNRTNEEYDGNMSDFKYEFPQKFEEATGNSTKAIKKISKKGKNQYEVRTSTYMSQGEMEQVADVMGMELVSYEKHSNIAISVFK